MFPNEIIFKIEKVKLLEIDFTSSKKFFVDKKIAPCITHYILYINFNKIKL